MPLGDVMQHDADGPTLARDGARPLLVRARSGEGKRLAVGPYKFGGEGV
jgi:hypothetical protein